MTIAKASGSKTAVNKLLCIISRECRRERIYTLNGLALDFLTMPKSAISYRL